MVHILPGCPIMADGPTQENIGQGSATTAPPILSRPFWHPSNFVALLRGYVVMLAIAFLTGLFVILTALILRAGLQPTPWDVYITHEVQELPDIIGEGLVAVSAPGFSPWNFIIPIAVVLIFILFRWFTEAAFTSMAAAGGFTAEIVKNLVDRPRPTPDLARIARELHTFSFPSGHVTGYVTLFGFLFYLAYTLLPPRHPLRWIVLIVCALAIILVGPSRVYMGQHWASDALAGYALGFAYLLAVIQIHRFWLKRGSRSEVRGASGQGPEVV
jgi:membrane-associated phospholipid phosphatase